MGALQVRVVRGEVRDDAILHFQASILARLLNVSHDLADQACKFQGFSDAAIEKHLSKVPRSVNPAWWPKGT